MGKRQAKKTGGLSGIFLGVAISLGIYLIGVFVLAWVVVTGALPSENVTATLVVWAMISTACGSLVARRVKGIKPMLACFLQGVAFAVMVTIMSYLIWEGPVWTKSSGILLGCGLMGGLLPGLFSVKGGGHRKGRYKW